MPRIKPETAALKEAALRATDHDVLRSIFRNNRRKYNVVWWLAQNLSCPPDVLYTIARHYEVMCPGAAQKARYHDVWHSLPASQRPWLF